MRFTHVLLWSWLGVTLATPVVLAEPTPVQLAGPTWFDTETLDTHDASPPLVVEAPGDIEISIRIVPTLHTKELRVYADSYSHYRSTTIGLDGIESDPVHTFTWRGFPAGDYDVVGMLIDDDGVSEVVVQGALRVVER